MRTEQVLVTGATGFTGGHLSERHAKEGYAVRAPVRDPTRCSALRGWGVELVPGDLCDPEALDRAVRSVDLVYHIAALFRPENVSRKEMWNVNVHGTRNLLDAAARARVRRFVHCSTVGAHGDIKKPPEAEDAPYGPGDHYQESKTEGERIALQYMAQGRLPIVVFRPGGIYNPRDLRFLKLFNAIKTRRFIMLGPGRVISQMVYIDDLVEGIVLCGTVDRAVGNVYILTGDKPVSLNDLVRHMAGVLGVPPPRLRFPVAPVYLAGFLCKPLGLDPPMYPGAA